MPPSGSYGHYTYLVHRYICRPSIHMLKIKIKEKFKINHFSFTAMFQVKDGKLKSNLTGVTLSSGLHLLTEALSTLGASSMACYQGYERASPCAGNVCLAFCLRKCQLPESDLHLTTPSEDSNLAGTLSQNVGLSLEGAAWPLNSP